MKKWIVFGFTVMLLVSTVGFTSLGSFYTDNPTYDDNPVVTMVTNMGTIEIELYEDHAPITVDNFINYVEDGFYDGLIFHRVIEGFMIQGGGFEPGMEYVEPTYPPIENEAATSGHRNLRGTIAMARTSDPHSATSQFFINHADNDFLDWDEAADGWGYCVFGQVIEGIDVVDAIAVVPTHSAGGYDDVPIDDVIMESVTVGVDDDDPYMIYDVYDLQAMSDDLEAHYVLANDIDASETEGWNGGAGFEPVGTYVWHDPSLRFTGTFDGQGYEIKGLYINRPSIDYIGLFGYIGEGAEIRDVSMVDADLNGYDYVGGLVGLNEGTVENSYATGKVSGDYYVGGLMGSNEGTVKNSYATGTLSGYEYVGGLVGGNFGTVENSYATGTVSGDWSVGGLVGRNSHIVSNSYATGTVNGYWSVGGLVGNNWGGTVENSFWDTENSGQQTCHGGTGKTTAEMMNLTTFFHADWDMVHVADVDERDTDYIWNIVDGQTYPFFSWQEDVKKPAFFELTIQSTYGGEVTVPGEGTFRRMEDSVVNLVARPHPGWAFDGWTGDIDTMADPYSFETTIIMDENKTITAHFLEMSYEIYNWNDLFMIRFDVEGDFTLMNDLDETTHGYNEYVDTEHGWEPIGDWDNPFSGTFDGNGYEIKGLYINRTGTDFMGLFGLVDESGVIHDVGLVDMNLCGGYEVTGGIVGVNYGAVSNSYVTGYMVGNGLLGGLVGGNSGTVENSYATVTMHGKDFVGGLVGWNYEGTVSNSYAIGDLTGDVGGGILVGVNIDGTVKNSYARGEVDGYEVVGGLIGGFISGTVENSHYNVDEVLINGRHTITFGALFDEQYRDWFENDLYLDIQNYDLTLVPTGNRYEIIGVQGIRDLLGFAGMNDHKFLLSHDIDLSDTPDLYIPYLAAEFDGNDHIIHGLRINMPFAANLGMFGFIHQHGEVRNLGVVDAEVNGVYGAGLLAGSNQGMVSYSYATGEVSGEEEVGGLVGINSGLVSNSFARVRVDGYWNVGGLVGSNGDYWSSEGTIDDSYATGDVGGEENVGGLVGTNGDTVTGSFASGNVSGRRDVGGLIGMNGDWYGGGTVENSYSTGSVIRKTGSTNTNFGGFVGNTRGVVINCFSMGSVHYEDETDPTDKGFAGYVSQGYSYEMSGNFWDVDTSGQTSTAGEATGKTTEDMKDISTFSDAGWDVTAVEHYGSRDTDHIWNTVDGITYPFLSWQEEINVPDAFLITIDSTPGGKVVHPGEGMFFYDKGVEVEIEASADYGWFFSHWTGDVPMGMEGNQNLKVVMDENKVLTAHFEEFAPLVIEITSPLDDQVFDTDSVTVEWVVDGGTYPIVNYEIRLDMGAWINKELDTSHTFEELKNGHYNVIVRAVDAEDHYHEKQVSFKVDVPEPEFVPENLVLDVIPSSGQAPLEVTITVSVDNVGDVEGTLELMVNNSVIYTLEIPANASAEHNQTYTFETPGTYEIRFGEMNKNVTVEGGTGDGTTSSLGMLMWVIPLVAIVVIVLVLVFIMKKKGGAETMPLDHEVPPGEESEELPEEEL